MAFAHIVIFIILNIISIESTEAFDDVILYFIPFIAVTVLGGIWGFNLSIRTIAPHYKNLRLPQRYLAFQLVLFFCKIQPILLNFIMKQLITTCDGPFTVIVKRHSRSRFEVTFCRLMKCSVLAIIQIIIQFQMLILSIWATILYKVPQPLKWLGNFHYRNRLVLIRSKPYQFLPSFY